VTVIEEVPPETETTEKEITLEPEAIIEEPMFPVIARHEAIQPLQAASIIEEIITQEEISTIDEAIEST
jgi:hypothetical protein